VQKPVRQTRRGLFFVGLAVVAVLTGWLARPVARTSAMEPASLVIRNGTILTVEDVVPTAQALAVRGDRIVAVGTEAEIAPYVGAATKVIDLHGATAMPGFIESHGHFMGTGEARMGLDLMNVASWDEVVAMVAAAVRTARPGQWITGRGWHQEKWTAVPTPNVEGFPIHDALSRVSPDNPVVLAHASGHAAFANAKAMALAGVTRHTPHPPGGEILKDQAGNPTGLFRETASGLLDQALSASRSKMTPQELEEEAQRMLQLATREALSYGVTTFHDAGVSLQTLDFYKREADAGRLGVRLYAMISAGNKTLASQLARYRTIGYAQNHLTIRAIKLLADGALGSRGAWFLEPYADMPGSKGLETTPVADMRETARLALLHGYQVATHAIGDRANREMLDIYESAFTANPDTQDVRWRIEHAQHINAADIPRFGSLNVLAAMQAIHCTSDAPFVLARLGQKRAEEGAYVWQKLMRTGARISNGTDTPVESMDTLANFYASVTRRTKDGSVFFGDQKMTRPEALRAYTINGAYAGFEEGLKGSLKVGKLADIAVLSNNLMTVPDDQIRSTKVLYTIVGGQVMFEGR
jgi:predicted amidohydrolase YtcJ